MEPKRIYVRMKRKTTFPVHSYIKVSDIARLSGTDKQLKQAAEEEVLYELKEADNEYAVIDSFRLIAVLNNRFPEVEWQMIGLTETIICVEQPKRKRWIPVKLTIAWLILFIGTAMTIMNFHYDVDMMAVHQKLHQVITGEKTAHPLWLQIPYSLGLGIGMVLFLNHWFQKRFNEEPSPLEIELFSYE